MNPPFVTSLPMNMFSLWGKTKKKRSLLSFDIDLTARCNNNCRHCYINLPRDDKEASDNELTLEEIQMLADEAISLGALWCLLTGGEPFLRENFEEIYLALKRKGLLVSIFTNATLLDENHIRLFGKYPPRDMEISVYGVTQETYEGVTRSPGSFLAFMRGLSLLKRNGIPIRLKAMALRSNIHEFPQITNFCRQMSKDYYRFDPFLHLRIDGNMTRNIEIKAERLAPSEIVNLEKSDTERFEALKRNCDKYIVEEFSETACHHLFHCGAGFESFTLGHNGYFRLCNSLCHPECVYDLRKGNLTDAWNKFVPKVRAMSSGKKTFLDKCRSCSLINLCMWCPAIAYLEAGEMDTPVDYFCQVAHARAKAMRIKD